MPLKSGPVPSMLRGPSVPKNHGPLLPMWKACGGSVLKLGLPTLSKLDPDSSPALPGPQASHLSRSSLAALQCCAFWLCASSLSRRSPRSCSRSCRSLREARSSRCLSDSCSRSLAATAWEDFSCVRSSCSG